MKIISNKSINYPLAGIIWITISLLLYTVLVVYFELNGNFWVIFSFVTGAVIAFGDRTNVPILSRGLLIFNGEEVTDSSGNSVWLEPGNYYTFFLFSTSDKEHQDLEKKTVIIPQFKCQDKTGKTLLAEANGDWEIDNNDIYKDHVEANMNTNLISLIRRSIIRVCGSLNFQTKILGKELGNLILENPVFIKESRKYGIEFSNLIADAIAFNLEQEDLNAYHEVLFKKAKSKYPKGYQFTHKEIREIESDIQVKLGQAKKVITNSATVGRFDV